MKKEKSESEKMQDELEPIWHSTEHDESVVILEITRKQTEETRKREGAIRKY